MEKFKKTIFALSIFAVANSAMASSFYFRSPVEGLHSLNVVDGEDDSSGDVVTDDGLDENGLEEEGETCTTYSNYEEYGLGYLEYDSGNLDDYLAFFRDGENIKGLSESNTRFYSLFSTGTYNSLSLTQLPSSIKSYDFASSTDTDGYSMGTFSVKDVTVSNFEYCGEDIDRLIATNGTGIVPEESEFTGYEFGDLEVNIYTMSGAFQCRIPVTLNVADVAQSIEYEHYDVTISPRENSVTLGANETSFTTYANPNKTLSAILTSSGDSLVVPSYNSTMENPVFEINEVVPYDSDNYYVIVYDKYGNWDDAYTVYKGEKLSSRIHVGQSHEGPPKITTTVGGEFDDGEGYDDGAKKEIYQIKFFGYCDMDQMAS